MHFPLCLIPLADAGNGGTAAVIALIVAFIGGIVWIAVYFDRKRTAELEAVAATLRLQFFRKGGPLFPDELARYELGTHGHSQRLQNQMVGTAGGIELAIFDYHYTTGYDDKQQTTSATIIRFRSPDLQLPLFVLRPEGFFSRIGSALGMQDIDFDSHPKFSKLFVLKGPDEQAIRALFQEPLLTSLEGSEGITIESSGQELLFYRTSRTVKPAALQAFLEDGFKHFTRFADASKRAAR